MRDILPLIPDKSIDLLTDPPTDFPYISYVDTKDNLIKKVFLFIGTNVKPNRYSIGYNSYVILSYPKLGYGVCLEYDRCYGMFGYTQWFPVLLYGKDLSGMGTINGVLKSDVITENGGGSVGFQRNNLEKEHTCPKPMSLINKLITGFRPNYS